MKKYISIIIVNWNGKKYLSDCIESLYKQTINNFKIYLVDNGSADGSSEYIKNTYGDIVLIQLDKNYGYAKGNNVGIIEALKDKYIKYIVCLNNDTIVTETWLEELVKTAESDEKIGAISSKAYFIGGVVIQNAGLIFDKALQQNKIGGISLGYGLKDIEIPELGKDCEIFCPGGVAPLYKREVLEKLYQRDKEIFDEDYFAYAEDYDLGFRIRKLGYICYLSANAKLIHLHSQTGGKSSPFKAYYCERNTCLTAVKNLPFLDLFLFPIRNILLKLSYLKIKNESVENLKQNISTYKMICILLKAYVSVLVLFPKFLYKRWRMK